MGMAFLSTLLGTVCLAGLGMDKKFRSDDAILLLQLFMSVGYVRGWGGGGH